MPCTLEPWEVRYEEKRINKEKYGQEVTDQEMLTRVACELARAVEEDCYSISIKNGFSQEVVDWWKRHKKWDRSQGR